MRATKSLMVSVITVISMAIRREIVGPSTQIRGQVRHLVDVVALAVDMVAMEIQVVDVEVLEDLEVLPHATFAIKLGILLGIVQREEITKMMEVPKKVSFVDLQKIMNAH